MGVYNKGCVTICTGIGPSIHWFCRNFQTPPDLVVDHWTSDVESSSPLDFRLLHAMWTPFGCLMSYKIRPIISVACDFTTKSGCAVKASWRNVARPQRMQVRSERLELSCADHSAR